MAGVHSISQKQAVQALKAGGQITHGVWYDNKPVVATSAGAVKVFEDGAEVAQFTSHAGPVTSLSLHPCGDILASTGVDKSYVLYDLESSKVLTQIYTDTGKKLIPQVHAGSNMPRIVERQLPPRRPLFCGWRKGLRNQSL